MEEKELLTRFGKESLEYQGRVGFILTFVHFELSLPTTLWRKVTVLLVTCLICLFVMLSLMSLLPWDFWG